MKIPYKVLVEVEVHAESEGKAVTDVHNNLRYLEELNTVGIQKHDIQSCVQGPAVPLSQKGQRHEPFHSLALNDALRGFAGGMW